MNPLIYGLTRSNGELKALSGQGDPGLWTLLGGSAPEETEGALRFSGGQGQVSSVSRVARARGDTRIAGVASGVNPDTQTPPGGSGRPRPVL